MGWSLLHAELTRSENDPSVIDSKTGLEWQDNSFLNTQNKMTYPNAVAYCEALELDGKSDWRLPNLNALRSIFSKKKSNPATYAIFTYGKISMYVTPTSYLAGTDQVWYIYTSQGTSSYFGESGYGDYYCARCVRDK